MELKQEILEYANSIKEDLINFRETIHSNPEVGSDLPNTKKYVKQCLTDMGLDVKEIGKSGLVTTIGSSNGKCFLLRADMDGLKVKEKTELTFCSKNDNMHACGHDMHTAMLLGACKCLKHFENKLNGEVKILFQPDEEGFTGAKEMIKCGVLDNPKVDAGLALHVHSGTPTGLVLASTGTSMAGCTLFRINVKGVGCHGAMPETGIDPINIATHIYLGLQEIIAREISPLSSAVCTIGKFSGGTAPNIIPQEVIMEGTIRTFDKDLTSKILKRIDEIARNIATSFNGQAACTELASAPPLKNDPELAGKIINNVKELLGEKSIYVMPSGGMGSEDFASFTYEIPCVYLLIGAGSEKENPLYGKPMHNELVVFNEDILPIGSAIETYSAINFLNN